MSFTIGLFNICDKVFVALEILVQWRELFKRGVPLGVAIESSIAAWTKCGQVIAYSQQVKLILLYMYLFTFKQLKELQSIIDYFES